MSMSFIEEHHFSQEWKA